MFDSIIFKLDKKVNSAYPFSAVKEPSAKGNDQSLEDKNSYNNNNKVIGVKYSTEDIEFIIKLSGIDKVENCHHNENMETIGLVSRRTIFKVIIAIRF